MKKISAYVFGAALILTVVAAAGMGVRAFFMVLMLLSTIGLMAYSVMKLTEKTP